MRATPAGITGVPKSTVYQQNVLQPVAAPQSVRGPKEAYLPEYQNVGSKVLFRDVDKGFENEGSARGN